MKFTFPPESQPLDGYTIKRGIHRGGFGEVYYALSHGGKEVALKLLQQNQDVLQLPKLKKPLLKSSQILEWVRYQRYQKLHLMQLGI